MLAFSGVPEGVGVDVVCACACDCACEVVLLLVGPAKDDAVVWRVLLLALLLLLVAEVSLCAEREPIEEAGREPNIDVVAVGAVYKREKNTY